MRIGIITLSRIKVNQGAFYNLQDMGLAKAFARAGHQVTLYRLTEDADQTERADGVTMIFRRTPGFDRQAVTGFSFLEEGLDRLICFSDNQVSFPALYRWCRRKGVLLQPYIGVLQSNSTNPLVAAVTNLLVGRNIRRYRKLEVYAKTPYMQEQLSQKGVGAVTVIPVCLDTDLLHRDAGNPHEAEKESLKRQWGYDKEDKILLFIGRMEPEKEPLEMLDILKAVRSRGSSYKLLMIGQGGLLADVLERAEQEGLAYDVKSVPHLLNQDIWQAYTISDCFVNLNRHEIYGMSILEALYYECPVVAMRAPGPSYMLQDICPENLCDTEEQAVSRILESMERREESTAARRKEWVTQRFCWDYVIRLFAEDMAL